MYTRVANFPVADYCMLMPLKKDAISKHFVPSKVAPGHNMSDG